MTNIWDDFFEEFDSFNKRFETLFSDLTNNNDGDIKTYGYTMFQGPDGVPHVHEYGNAVGEQTLISDNVREPLTDVSVEDDTVRIIAELPGVQKEDIQLEGKKNALTITVDTLVRKFKKTLALPCDVDLDTAKAEYNNGILEVTFIASGFKPNGKRISIE